MIRRLFFLLMTAAACACGKAPDTGIPSGQTPAIAPDYTDVTLPYNIAPLRFRVMEQGDRFRAVFRAGSESIACRSRSGDIRTPRRAWKKLLEGHRNEDLLIEISVKQNGRWETRPAIRNHIAGDPVDTYLTYRLLEPGYVNYGNMIIQERNLENFRTRTLVSNRRELAAGTDCCINCHTPRNRDGAFALFQVRGPLGGAVLSTPDGATRLNMKTDSTFAATVYPAWHPTLPRIVFSINNIGQLFHTADVQKIEVFDSRSDLVIYDMDTKTLSAVCRTDDAMETFPVWSPDGQFLYYCSAAMPAADSTGEVSVIRDYRHIHYDLMRRPYDAATGTFGEAEIMVRASSSELSVTFPRISPDGRFLLFCLSEYGTFSIWHRNTDLYLIDFETHALRPLEKVNSRETESYHTWSSNGRWIVFSSRRDDGNFTRPYIAYMDRDGHESKPFVLPQRRPDFYDRLLKSFNIPEFMISPSLRTWRQYDDIIHAPATQITYQ